MRIILPLFALILICSSLQAQYEGDHLFDESFIHEIHIDVPSTLDELTVIHHNNLFSGNDPIYKMGTIQIDGMLLDSIGVRVKGGFSSYDPKKPLKIDFNEFNISRKYDGLVKFNLQQGNMESSFMREAIAYNILRNAGVKAPRTSFTKVYFNGTYQGIYTIIEQINKDFLHNRFADNDGALYKTADSQNLELKWEDDDSLPYEDFVAAVNAIPTDLLHEQLPNYLDVESYFRFFAIQVFINHRDGPLDVDYNYYMYYEPKSATYVYIPWDFNLCLYNGASFDVIPNNTANQFFSKAMSNTTLRNRYLDSFCKLMSVSLDWEEGFQKVKNTISTRYESVSNDLNNCTPLVNPINPQSVVINEIVASNSGEDNYHDSNGEAEDWIELYNNTAEDISLKDCYLSDDIDVLKHWRFSEDATIPANDYLIIWADRDVQQGDFHVDFKLSKTKGDVFLSYENGDILDQVSYENLDVDDAFARIPNGTGDFVKQIATFNEANDSGTISTENIPTEFFNIYPNPTQDFIQIDLKKNENIQVDIYNSLGQNMYQSIISSSTYISINHWNKGIYTIQLSNSEMQYNFKIIKI